MISNDIKTRIVLAISGNRQNYATDAKHAVALGISTSVYSEIKKGNTEQKLSDAKWMSIARRLGVSLDDGAEWKIVKTPTFEYLTSQLELCRAKSLSGMFCDIPNIGKTVAAQYHAKTHKNVVYVDCSQVKTKQRLVRFIAREFGLNSVSRYADVYDDLVFYLRTLDHPQIILDEAGDLVYEAPGDQGRMERHGGLLLVVSDGGRRLQGQAGARHRVQDGRVCRDPEPLRRQVQQHHAARGRRAPEVPARPGHDDRPGEHSGGHGFPADRPSEQRQPASGPFADHQRRGGIVMRAYSPSEIENLNIPELPLDGEWEAAFGRPSRFERWFIDGESASGKSTFVMLLGKKLCDYGRVDYVSLEEGANLSFKKRIKRLGMKDVAGKFKVVTGLTVADLVARLERPKSANFVIIDSVQYLDVRSFDRLKKELFDRFPRKSFILVSQVYKGRPKGKMADDIRFDCGVKIHTKGYRAYCQGRYTDDAEAYFTIWEEGAAKYYLTE